MGDACSKQGEVGNACSEDWLGCEVIEMMLKEVGL